MKAECEMRGGHNGRQWAISRVVVWALLFTSQATLDTRHSAAYAAGWPQLQCTPQRTGRSPEALTLPKGATIDLVWERRFWPERINDAVQPVIAGGKVYVGSREGTMYCLDAEDGKDIWATRGFGPILFAAGVTEGKVIFGGLDGYVHALDAETGAETWKVAGPYGFTTAPLIAEDRVFIGSRGGVFFCLAPQEGKVLWQVDTGSQILQTAAWDNGVVYFGSEDLCMRAYEAQTGKSVWQSAPSHMRSMGPYWPVLHKGYVIIRCGAPQYTPRRRKVTPLLGDRTAQPSREQLREWDECFRTQKNIPDDFFTRQGKLVDRIRSWNPGAQELFVSGVPTLYLQREGNTMSDVKREPLFDATESKTPGMCGSSMRGNRETPEAPPPDGEGGRSEKAEGRTSDMQATGESDVSIVPAKRANKTGTPVAESVKERETPKGNAVSTLLAPDAVPGTRGIGRAGVRQVKDGVLVILS